MERNDGVTAVTFDPHDPVFSIRGGDDPRVISRLVAPLIRPGMEMSVAGATPRRSTPPRVALRNGGKATTRSV
jgi:hypothetical protein